MTQEEINEGNRLIAKFMFPTIEKEAEEDNFVIEKLMFAKMAFFLKDYARLEFHTKWDWLMPVVEKIVFSLYSQLHMNNAQIILSNDRGFEFHKRIPTTVTGAINQPPIEITWLAVVEFIKWYNKQDNT